MKEKGAGWIVFNENKLKRVKEDEREEGETRFFLPHWLDFGGTPGEINSSLSEAGCVVAHRSCRNLTFPVWVVVNKWPVLVRRHVSWLAAVIQHKMKGDSDLMCQFLNMLSTHLLISRISSYIYTYCLLPVKVKVIEFENVKMSSCCSLLQRIKSYVWDLKGGGSWRVQFLISFLFFFFLTASLQNSGCSNVSLVCTLAC